RARTGAREPRDRAKALSGLSRLRLSRVRPHKQPTEHHRNEEEAGTSPSRWPACSAGIDCTAMMPPCTTLDHTVNQIKLRWACGSLDAISRKTPSVAYTPTIIMKYWDSWGAPACHAQPDGHTIARG